MSLPLAALALCGRDGPPLAVRGGGEGRLVGVLPCIAGMGIGTQSGAHACPASVGGGGVDDCTIGGDGFSSIECARGRRWGGCLWGGRTRWHCAAAGEPRGAASCARARVTHTHRTCPVSPTRRVRAGTAAAASPCGTCIPRGLQPLVHGVATAST